MSSDRVFFSTWNGSRGYEWGDGRVFPWGKPWFRAEPLCWQIVSRLHSFRGFSGNSYNAIMWRMQTIKSEWSLDGLRGAFVWRRPILKFKKRGWLNVDIFLPSFNTRDGENNKTMRDTILENKETPLNFKEFSHAHVSISRKPNYFFCRNKDTLPPLT